MQPSSDIIYGINPAFEVVRAGRRAVHRAWLASGAADSPRLRKLTDLLARAGVPYRVTGRASPPLPQPGTSSGFKTAPYPYVPTAQLLVLRLHYADNRKAAEWARFCAALECLAGRMLISNRGAGNLRFGSKLPPALPVFKFTGMYGQRLRRQALPQGTFGGAG